VRSGGHFLTTFSLPQGGKREETIHRAKRGGNFDQFQPATGERKARKEQIKPDTARSAGNLIV